MSKQPKERREDARAQAQRLREEQARAARRQRTLAITFLLVGLVAIGGVVAWIFSNQPETVDFSEAENPLAEVVQPASATETGGFVVGPDGVVGQTDGAADDAVEVVVYSDYMCPICNQFEQLNGPLLDEAREAGEVVVEYRPVAILDRYAQGTEYSTRSATAAGLVADRAPEAFLGFNAALFANQPAENTSGLDDATIAGIARDAGVPEDVAATIEDGSYLEGDDSFRPWVAAATEQATRDFPEGFGTPTILLDGENLADLGVDWRVEGALAAAIEEARG